MSRDSTKPRSPDSARPSASPFLRAARTRSGEGVLRLVGGLVVLLAGVPVFLIFALVATDGEPTSESRCTVASCDAGADREPARAPSPTSQN